MLLTGRKEKNHRHWPLLFSRLKVKSQVCSNSCLTSRFKKTNKKKAMYHSLWVPTKNPKYEQKKGKNGKFWNVIRKNLFMQPDKKQKLTLSQIMFWRWQILYIWIVCNYENAQGCNKKTEVMLIHNKRICVFRQKMCLLQNILCFSLLTLLKCQLRLSVLVVIISCVTWTDLLIKPWFRLKRTKEKNQTHFGKSENIIRATGCWICQNPASTHTHSHTTTRDTVAASSKAKTNTI